MLTAIVLIPIVVGLTYLGGLPFLALLVCLTTLAEIEFCLLISRRPFRGIHVFGIAVVWLFLFDGKFPDWALLRPGLTAILSLSFVWQVLRCGPAKVRDWAGALTSGVYVGLFGSFFLRLRDLPGHGLYWTFFAALTIVMADSAAYFAGTAWGKHRLAPTVSFAKTWEGYVSGIMAGGLSGGFIAWLGAFIVGSVAPITFGEGLVLGMLIGSFAPVGDLAISVIKREAGVKDSGHLLPGHGGMLDRIDSVLWAGALAYYYVTWFVH